MSDQFTGNELPEELNLDYLRNTLEEFANRLSALLFKLAKSGLDLSDLEIDHIALRVADWNQAEKLYQELKAISVWENRAENVNGRPVVMFQLADPITLFGQQIRYLELPYPKKGYNYPDGWEHIEFILGGNARTEDELEHNITKRFPNFHPANLKDIKYSITAQVVPGMPQPINPTLTLEAYPGLSVKILPKPIRDVIEEEKRILNS